MRSRLVFHRNTVIFDHCSKGCYWSVKMVLRTASRMVSSHQTRDPRYFAERSTIPWKPPTIRCKKIFACSKNFKLSWVSWEVFVLYPLCCQVLYHHGISMMVPRFTFFTQNFLICNKQITEIFRSGPDCTSTSSARRTCFFLSSSRNQNLGPAESAFLHCAYPNLVHLLLAAPLEFQEMTWK